MLAIRLKESTASSWPACSARPHITALLLVLLSLAGIHRSFAAGLDPGVLQKVRAATFEVVIPKPTTDPLTYEKALPLDLLPYQFRNDKYLSIGTAFALGGNRYVTAAHVIDSGIGSLLGAPALRDADGHVYAIDNIAKFSLGQDFVVFSLAAQPATQTTLDIDTTPALNSVVYTVGNALGTGVIVRDGLYTSDTPEDQDGRWKWMRFSAAASPGNSGGPLLDKDGKIIGIVLMKSPNENLNYALPISEVLNAPDHLAVIDKRSTYRASFFDAAQTSRFKQSFALPKNFADFSATYLTLRDAFADDQLKALRQANAGQIFPNGSQSNRLLHANADLRTFPSLIRRNANGTWLMTRPQASRSSLPKNGYVEASVMAGSLLLMHLRKPDDVTAGALYGDAKAFMDLTLKSWSFYRDVGPDKVRVTSLGEPTRQTVYSDAYQRHWQVRVWPLAYGNALVLAFSLPVPDGYVSMIRVVPAGQEHPSLIDMQATCDFIDMSYGGTLAQWKDYLTQKTLLPAVFSQLDMRIDYGHQFTLRSGRFTLSYTPDLQKIEADSYLDLGFAFIPTGGDPDRRTVSWEVADVEARPDALEKTRINVNRHIAPTDDLDDSAHSQWNKFKQRLPPDDSVAYSKDGFTRIATVVGEPSDASTVLYTAFVAAEGSVPQDTMKTRLDHLVQGLQVSEH
jgi:serine protease Do